MIVPGENSIRGRREFSVTLAHSGLEVGGATGSIQGRAGTTTVMIGSPAVTGGHHNRSRRKE